MITPSHLAKSFSYQEYRQLLDSLLAQQKTTGDDHSPALIEYTKLNIQRMHRLDKSIPLQPGLSEKLLRITEPIRWVVLTEGWCGDAAQNLPIIAKMADAAPNITLRLLLRDENPDVMNDYLTGGSRSIPKLICLDGDTLEELGTWGPRPQVLQEMVMAYKRHPHVPKAEFYEQVHGWYVKDKTRSLQAEFEQLLPQWTQKAVR